jgi:hypothetical protein
MRQPNNKYGLSIPEPGSATTAGHQPSCHTHTGVLRAIACAAFIMVVLRAEKTTGRNSGMFGTQSKSERNLMSKCLSVGDVAGLRGSFFATWQIELP